MSVRLLFLLTILASAAYARTTLDRAFSAAYNERVFDGTWASIFAEEFSGILPSGACSGDWEWPDPMVFEDLNQVLGHGLLVCGYPKDLSILNNRGQVLLDTTGDFARGQIVQFFKAIAISISEHYGTTFQVDWNIDYSSASEVLNAVLLGELDAACGRFAYGATFVTNGTSVPRAHLLSPNTCVTYFEEITLWTRDFLSDVLTWDEMIYQINLADGDRNLEYNVCVTGHPDGGQAQLCSSTIRQYSNDKEYECIGLGTYSFPNLVDPDGECDAVWGSSPQQGQRRNFNRFPAPLLGTQGTFFRIDDENADLRMEFDNDDFD